MVSGIASMMMTVALSSGFSASVAAAAGPMRDCAQAVAMAGIAMASAALREIHRMLMNGSYVRWAEGGFQWPKGW